jgi:hypothetical protein
VEAEQRFGSVTVVDQPVERRQERHAARDRTTVACLGMRDPAASLETNAEGAEALLPQDAIGFFERDHLCLRVPALRQIPESLAVAAPDDRDLTAGVQHVEKLSHPALAVPAVRLPALDSSVLELT